MIKFSGSKLNLGLHILRKRTDGYHDIESVFYPLNWQDVVEIIPSRTRKTSFRFYGQNVPNLEQNNNLIRTLNLLEREKGSLPPLEVHVLKNVPAGAGLGGGSANAAAFLEMLCELFKIPLNLPHKIRILQQIGSDCPFFLFHKPCLVSGKGECIEPLDIDPLKGYYVVCIWPGIHSDTTTAYKHCIPSEKKYSIKEILLHPIEKWKDMLQNDFETTVFRQLPQLSIIKNLLYEKGALYASMSGSGSTMYGIYSEKPTPSLWNLPEHYRLFCQKY